MMKTTKLVAWAGAIFGLVAIIAMTVIIGAVVYAGYRDAEQRRQQQQSAAAVKQEVTKDLQQLSRMEIKPMTEDDYRKWTSGVSSPTPTPEK